MGRSARRSTVGARMTEQETLFCMIYKTSDISLLMFRTCSTHGEKQASVTHLHIIIYKIINIDLINN